MLLRSLSLVRVKGLASAEPVTCEPCPERNRPCNRRLRILQFDLTSLND